jgi:hypothetical protein
MKEYSTTFLGGTALIGAAALLLAVAALTGRGDMTSATLVLVAVGTFVGGVILLTQYRGEPVVPWVAGLATAGPVIDLARLCTDLGFQGNAHLLIRNEEIVQVVPIRETLPVLPSDDYSFIIEENGGGVQLQPTGWLLYERLVRDHALVIPEGVDGLCTAIREVGEDVLCLADRIVAAPEGDGIVVQISGYRLYEGCRAVHAVSPKCCTMIGCPVCNLFACMAVAGLHRGCTLEHVSIDDHEQSVKLVLRIL